MLELKLVYTVFEPYIKALAEEVFDFELIKSLLSRSDFKMKFDAMHAITGAYARPILVDALGADPSSCVSDTPKEDFAGGHPDQPNLRERIGQDHVF